MERASMPTPMKSSNNLHSVYVYGQPLGVECKGCGHRALTLTDGIDDFRGNMRELRALRFTCSSCGAGLGRLVVRQTLRSGMPGSRA
jgi:hypothetical protein